MKKRVVICCVLCALLVGCAPIGEGAQSNTQAQKNPSASTEGTVENSQTGSQSPILSLEEAQTRLAYYEGLVAQLQEDLLSAQAELYTKTVAYEERIEALLAGTVGTEKPSEESFFEYRIENERAIVTSYTGSATEVRIPASLGGYAVGAIADSAFANNTHIASVTVPASVTSIGWFAFSGCVFLTDVTLTASLQSIAYGAFENCSAALTLRCPNGSYAQQYARSYGLRTVS